MDARSTGSMGPASRRRWFAFVIATASVALCHLVAWPAFAAHPASAQVADGRALAEALGCGACHSGMPAGETIRSVTPALVEGEANLAPAYIFHYLQNPQAVRPDLAPARMPTYALSEGERVALALFITNDDELRGVDDALREAMARHPDADREAGRALFGALNCAACHAHADLAPAVTAPDLSLTAVRVRPEWLTAYLAGPVTIRPAGPVPGQGGQMPDFRLSANEVAALSDFLLGGAGTAPSLGQAADPGWEPARLSRFSMDKAQVLLRDRWSCLGCHQLGDDGGRIGPRLDGIAERLRPAYLRALIEDPAHLAPGTVMPASLEQPDRLDLVASYLLQREAPWTGGQAVAIPLSPPASADAGAVLYAARCALCHGATGQGDGFNAAYLPTQPTMHADSAAMSLRTDDTLYDGIHAGGRILGKSHRMPAFGASLDDGEKRSLVAYIRTLCNCQGPAWSRDGRRGR